jgi:hypothetical protein
LVTENAVWHAPDFLTEGVTENIALSIGDAQRLQDAINATIPDDVARPPLPVDVTAGTVIRAKLTVISSDATISPLETLDRSIGDQVSLLFPWQIQPHVAGELKLQAIIFCPRADGSVTTENVPLRIRVHPAVKPPAPPPVTPSLGDRLRGFFDLLKNYWIQLTTIGGGLVAAGRYGWRWYSRRRGNEHPTPVAEPKTGADEPGTTTTAPAGKADAAATKGEP